MLMIKRRIHEEIIIGENIRIVFKSTGPKSCQVAIEAPLSVNIRRGELTPCNEQIVSRAKALSGSA